MSNTSTSYQKQLLPYELAQRMACYDRVCDEFSGDIRKEVAHTLGILFNQEKSVSLTGRQVPCQHSVYFYCVGEEDTWWKPGIVFRESVWMNGVLSFYLETSIQLHHLLEALCVTSYQEVKRFFIDRFDSPDCYEQIRAFVDYNAIPCYREEVDLQTNHDGIY